MTQSDESKPIALILRTAGTNCDMELAHAFEQAGAETETIHLNTALKEPDLFERFDLLGLPGGFSYGDDIAAGRILANRLKHQLYPALRGFVAAGKPIIGICNGFQVLVKTGLIGMFNPEIDQVPPAQVVTLTDNALPRFRDHWVTLNEVLESRCIWTKGLGQLDVGIAHGEGRIVADETTLDTLQNNGQIALTYAENPNGSMRDIAGLCDASGLVFGLMPHPERFLDNTNHPEWTRQINHETGLRIFTNAVDYVKNKTATPA